MNSDTLHTIINRKINSRLAKSILSEIGERPLKEAPLDTHLFYSYQNAGIEISIQTPENLIKYVSMVGGNVATNLCEFKGRLPENLFFGDTAADVEVKLGPAYLCTKWPDSSANWQKSLVYNRHEHSLNLNFDKNDKLVRVTLAELEF